MKFFPTLKLVFEKIVNYSPSRKKSLQTEEWEC